MNERQSPIGILAERSMRMGSESTAWLVPKECSCKSLWAGSVLFGESPAVVTQETP